MMLFIVICQVTRSVFDLYNANKVHARACETSVTHTVVEVHAEDRRSFYGRQVGSCGKVYRNGMHPLAHLQSDTDSLFEVS